MLRQFGKDKSSVNSKNNFQQTCQFPDFKLNQDNMKNVLKQFFHEKMPKS